MASDEETTAEPTGPTTTTELQVGDLIRIDAGGWGLTWAVREDRQLAQIGVGPHGPDATVDVPLAFYPLAHRCWGAGDPFHEAALRVTHADGTLSTRLQTRTVTRETGPTGEHIRVGCHDELLAFTLEHHFRTHPASGVLEQWVEIEHHESAPVRLHDYDSLGHLLLVTPDAEICQFGGGGWADEWRWTTERLHPGIRALTSLGGVQPHLQRAPLLLLSPDGPSSENHGTTIALSIAWGGNTRFRLEVRPRSGSDGSAELTISAGANPYGAEYLLDPGRRFVTPTVAWVWSEGRAAATNAFHRWTRDRVLRDPQRTRALVANNWEATFFDFDEQRILDLISRSAQVGAEVFLLDDGWFGAEFPRNDDDQGLGDWEVDTTKLPGGLAALASAAQRAGIRFGIWVEPEMVNPRSRLHREHPDWVQHDDREPQLHRNQLYLDPLLAEVRDFECAVIDRTLAAAPGTSYVKWDANRPITDPGSRALPPDRRANAFVDGVQHTWEVMARVARAHPEVDLMLCASGGGRTDHGTLRFFHEFWTSDNTDPVTRIRMQWACLHFFPAAAMAAHVTRWGQHPLGFTCAAALPARFGIDLDLASLDETERTTVTHALTVAKRTRELVQHGRLQRLLSPVDEGDRSRAALAFSSPDPAAGMGAGRDTPAPAVVLFRYQITAPTAAAASMRALDCVAPEQQYRVRRTTFTDTVADGGETLLRGAEVSALLAEWHLGTALSADVTEIRGA